MSFLRLEVAILASLLIGAVSNASCLHAQELQVQSWSTEGCSVLVFPLRPAVSTSCSSNYVYEVDRDGAQFRVAPIRSGRALAFTFEGVFSPQPEIDPQLISILDGISACSLKTVCEVPPDFRGIANAIAEFGQPQEILVGNLQPMHTLGALSWPGFSTTSVYFFNYEEIALIWYDLTQMNAEAISASYLLLVED